MAAKLPAVDNVSLFNAVRDTLGQNFQDRIPEATVENMREISTVLTSTEFKAEYNSFAYALMNRIGKVLFYDKTVKNPLSKYIYGEMEFGAAIEEIAVDIIKGYAMDFGKDGKSIDPFIRNDNQPLAEYHKIMTPIQYCTTLERHRMRQAFLANGGVMRVLGMQANALYSSANLDTWTLTKSEIAYYVNDEKAASGLPLQPTQKIHFDDVVDEESAKKFLIQVKNALYAIQFPNNMFNPQKYHKTLERRNMTLFIRYDILTVIGVEALSAAFNIEQLNLNVSIEPMEGFGISPKGEGTDDVAAILAEDNWLLITQQYEEMDSIYNPAGLYENFFLTRAMSFGTTYFRDAIIWRKSYPKEYDGNFRTNIKL